MGIDISDDPGRNLTVFAATGELTYEAQIDVLRKFYTGRPTPNVIWDLRALTGMRLSTEEIAKIIAYIKKYQSVRPKGKTALVTSTDVDFGLSRMSEMLAEGEKVPWSIRAFRSMAQAMQWIDDTQT